MNRIGPLPYVPPQLELGIRDACCDYAEDLIGWADSQTMRVNPSSIPTNGNMGNIRYVGGVDVW